MKTNCTAGRSKLCFNFLNSYFRMDARVLLLTAFVAAVGAFGQDTLLQDQGDVYHAKSPESAKIAKLERHMDRKLRDLERKLSTQMEVKFRRMEQNYTGSIKVLETKVWGMAEELQALKDTEQRQEVNIRRLREYVLRQKDDLDKIEIDFTQMKDFMNNLSSIVEGLSARKHHGGKGGPWRKLPTGTPRNNTTPKTTTTPFTPIYPTDCEDVFNNGGMKYPGDYYILIQPLLSPQPFQVCCKMTNHSGWTIFQRRQDGSVDFYKTWQDYKSGFGDLHGEFWLGNDRLYQLTNQGDYMLRIEMEDWKGQNFWAEYDHFSVSNEADNYRLHINGYRGNAGDSLTSYWEDHNNQPFSTRDRDNDDRFYDNCAEHYHGAWWFKSCYESHLNGIYYHRGTHNSYFVRNGIQWNSIHLHASLKTVAMMVKPTTVNHLRDERGEGHHVSKRGGT